jgi:hypothetical protein
MSKIKEEQIWVKPGGVLMENVTYLPEPNENNRAFVVKILTGYSEQFTELTNMVARAESITTWSHANLGPRGLYNVMRSQGIRLSKRNCMHLCFTAMKKVIKRRHYKKSIKLKHKAIYQGTISKIISKLKANKPAEVKILKATVKREEVAAQITIYTPNKTHHIHLEIEIMHNWNSRIDIGHYMFRQKNMA